MFSNNALSDLYRKTILDPISNKMSDVMVKIESKKIIDIIFRKYYINEYNKLSDLLHEKYKKYESLIEDEI